mgnify:CR=1 FL=1
MSLRAVAQMYNKIFTKILDSSIWLEPDATRIVWLTCIAAMDEDGFCAFAAPANLARRANVEMDACQKALVTLEGPDPNSSDPEHEGRRLERVPGGWVVLNAAKYRELVTRQFSRESTRIRVKRHREKRNAAGVTGALPIVTRNASEAYTEAEVERDSRASLSPAAMADPALASQLFPKRGATVFAGALQRDHLRHASCSPNFSWCVPEQVHYKLAGQLAPKHGGDVEAAKAALLAWYPTVWAQLPPDTVMPDAFKFWGGWFDKQLASKAGASAVVGEAVRGCKHTPRCADAVAHTKLVMAEKTAV